jgi:hypothetical protein
LGHKTPESNKSEQSLASIVASATPFCFWGSSHGLTY